MYEHAINKRKRFHRYLTPQEEREIIAMSDLLGQNKQASVDSVFTKKNGVMSTGTYRVQVQSDGKVSIISWGLAKDVEETYDSVDKLPEWMQSRLAVLMVFDPTKINNDIKGVGRRISRGTFWLYPDEGEDDGDDTGAPGKGAGA